ncbi:MAG: hypothetical protein LC731_04355, partial [Acidobacteria bacterium]|nr:hypothetical protein [Acidobacteriota bacterium]
MPLIFLTMLMALLLALVAISGGALATYLYDESAPLQSRLCTGACVGFAALGLAGFLFASAFGALTPVALLLAAAVVASPLFLLKDAGKRARVMEDWRALQRAVFNPARGEGIVLIFYAVVAVLLWLLFD